MVDVQAMALACKSGRMAESEFIESCSSLIKAYTNKWWNMIGKGDGREYDEKEQLCTIWCWEALKVYEEAKGNFTTLYYRHCKNRIVNLIKKRERHNEKANSYDTCFSYEWTIENEDEEEGNSLYGKVYSVERGYEEIDIELALKNCGIDDLKLEIVKYKLKDPNMSCASIATLLDCSRAYVSLLWKRTIPLLIQELKLT
jgi:DNA-directed RNA polymerase specialized sigma24 family protein